MDTLLKHLLDGYPLPWRAAQRSRHFWKVNAADGSLVADDLSESVAKLLAGAPELTNSASAVLLDADESEEAPGVSMVASECLQRLQRAVAKAQARGVQ